MAHRIEAGPEVPALVEAEEGAVVLPGEAGGQGQRARPARPADNQRRVRDLHRSRSGVLAPQHEMLALEVERLAGPAPDQNFDVLGQKIESCRDVGEGKTVLPVLPFEPTGADSHIDAAPGDVIGGDGDAGQFTRMAEGGGGYQRPQPDPIGRRRQRVDGGPRVQGRARLAVEGRVVIRSEESVEAR